MKDHDRKPSLEPRPLAQRRKEALRRLPAPEIVGDLARIRGEKATSQRDVETSIGCRIGNLSYWERGLAHPGVGNLEAWANALGYRLALVEREGG